MSFREWLRGLLEDGEYRSQVEMAEAFSVTQPAICYWLSGASRPDLESCGRISKVTGKPLADIAEMIRCDAQGNGDGADSH